MKSNILKIGQVFEMARESHYAYCVVIRKDSVGFLFEVLDDVYDTPQAIDSLRLDRGTVCYINEYSLPKSWRIIGQVGKRDVDIPPLFDGHPHYSWTVYEGGEKRSISAGDVTANELVMRGYIPRVLWLAPAVEDFVFAGKPLVWDWEAALSGPSSGQGD